MPGGAEGAGLTRRAPEQIVLRLLVRRASGEPTRGDFLYVTFLVALQGVSTHSRQALGVRHIPKKDKQQVVLIRLLEVGLDSSTVLLQGDLFRVEKKRRFQI